MPGCYTLSSVLWKLVNACDINSHHNTKLVSQAEAIPQYSHRSILKLQHILVWRAYFAIMCAFVRKFITYYPQDTAMDYAGWFTVSLMG